MRAVGIENIDPRPPAFIVARRQQVVEQFGQDVVCDGLEIWRDIALGPAIEIGQTALKRVATKMPRDLVNHLFGGRHALRPAKATEGRSEEHTFEVQSLMRTSYAVFGLKKKNTSELQSLIRTSYAILCMTTYIKNTTTPT